MATRREHRSDRLPVLLDVDEFARLPPQIFVASRSPLLGEPHLIFELRETRQGQLAIMAYSTLAALARACGTGQSWTRIQSRELPWLKKTIGFDVLIFDLELPVELRHPELGTPEASELTEISLDANPADRFYVPSRPFHNGQRRVRLELQRAANGKPALLVYFTLDQLRAGCGPHQPWVCFPVDELERVARDAGARTVLFNPVLAEHARHTKPSARRKTGG